MTHEEILNLQRLLIRFQSKVAYMADLGDENSNGYETEEVEEIQNTIALVDSFV